MLPFVAGMIAVHALGGTGIPRSRNPHRAIVGDCDKVAKGGGRDSQPAAFFLRKNFNVSKLVQIALHLIA